LIFKLEKIFRYSANLLAAMPFASAYEKLRLRIDRERPLRWTLSLPRKKFSSAFRQQFEEIYTRRYATLYWDHSEQRGVAEHHLSPGRSGNTTQHDGSVTSRSDGLLPIQRQFVQFRHLQRHWMSLRHRERSLRNEEHCRAISKSEKMFIC